MKLGEVGGRQGKSVNKISSEHARPLTHEEGSPSPPTPGSRWECRPPHEQAGAPGPCLLLILFSLPQPHPLATFRVPIAVPHLLPPTPASNWRCHPPPAQAGTPAPFLVLTQAFPLLDPT